MTGRLKILSLLILLGTSFAVAAETVYISERIRIGLRADMVETSAVVKTVETGMPLEVVERFEKHVRVRDAQGTEGWIEARYLTTEPPTRAQLASLQEELAKARKQAGDAQALLKQAQATIAEQAGKVKELEKAQLQKPAGAAPAAISAPSKTPPVEPEVTGGGFRFNYLWLGISFAMLVVGFAAGIRWLRESIRKRSGGMYLRV